MELSQTIGALRNLFCLTLGLGAALLHGAASSDTALVDDLRLRLGDKLQELRTTSLNWNDLPPALSRPPAPPRPPPVAPAPKPPAAAQNRPRAKRFRILIDAGHGGRDLGAIGHAILEKDLSLKISRMVRRELYLDGALKHISLEVRFSRGTDDFVSLGERVRIANHWNADLFVSIHGNASDYPGARGFEVYFLNAEASDANANDLARFENEGEEGGGAPIKHDVLSILSDAQANQHVSESSRFAEAVYRSLLIHFQSSGRGVRQAPFRVLHGTQMPAILVEVGYLTSRKEARNLRRRGYLKRLASAISSGIIDFASSVGDLI